MKILFLHGLESGPYGRKYKALKDIFGEVLAPDCTGIAIAEERLEVIQEALQNESGPFLVVGSSMGGLMALLLQQALPQRVAGMVLCAPALHRPEADGFKSRDLPPAIIIHGVNDAVVPIKASRDFGAELIEVEDDHGLSRSMTVILRAVFDLKAKLGGY